MSFTWLRPHPLPGALALGLVGIALNSALASTACARPLDLTLTLELDAGRDSNPFLAPSRTATMPAGSEPVASRFQSQTVQAALGVPLDSERSRCILSGRWAAFQYQPLEVLNTHTTQAQLRCPWQSGPMWQGELSAQTTRDPTPYWDGSNRVPDLRTQQQVAAGIRLLIDPELDVPLAVQHRRLRHQDQAVHGSFDVDETHTQLALRWQPPTGSLLQVNTELLQSNFPNRTAAEVSTLDARWQEARVGLEAQWRYSPLTQLGGRVGVARRSYATLSERNFSMAEGAVNLSYWLRPQSRIDLQAWRNTQDSYQADALFTIAHGQRLSWTSATSADTHWQLTATRGRDSTTVTNAATGATTQAIQPDRSLNARLMHRLTPALSLQMATTLRRTRHASQSSDIQDTLWQVGLRYSFENRPGALTRNGLQDDF